MSKEPRYIPFPLFLVADLPGNLDEIFDYGIYNFARSIELSNISVVYRQVLYGYYRGKLPASVLRTIRSLINNGSFIPDEDYQGFNENGQEFDPETGIRELILVGLNNKEFQNACIEYWQTYQGMQVLNLSGGDVDSILASAKRTQKVIDDWETKWGRDVTVMISITMMFEFYKQSKSEYEIDLLRAFLSIKSILGNKQLVGTTKEYVVMRMTGARKKELLPEILNKPGLQQLYDKYQKRYHIDKMLSELLSRGFITGKLAFNRRIYLSTHFKTSELPEAVHQLLLNINSKIKRDQNNADEKAARAQLQKLIKSN